MKEREKELLQGFTVDELVDFMEIDEEDLLERFEDRLNENNFPFLYGD